MLNPLDAKNCPNVAKHIPSPEGYVEWHEWAEQMEETHEQKQCPTCKLWAIWEKKQDENCKI